MGDALNKQSDVIDIPIGPSPEPLLQFFAYDHLPVHLQATSRAFSELAKAVVLSVPRNPERTVALRKLLEAKDSAIRAILYKG